MRTSLLLGSVLLLGIAGAVPPKARAGERPIVAVFDVEDRGTGQKPETLLNLVDFMVVRLTENGYQVVPRDQLRERLRAQKKESYKLCYDQTCQIEMGRELAAQKSLSTQLLRVGENCHVVTVLYDLKRSATDKAAKVETACDQASLLKAFDQAITRLVGAAPVREEEKRRAWFVAVGGGVLIPTGKISYFDDGTRIEVDPDGGGVGTLHLGYAFSDWISAGLAVFFGGSTARYLGDGKDYGYWISCINLAVDFGYDFGPVDLRLGGLLGMHAVGGEIESELSEKGGAIAGLNLGGYLRSRLAVVDGLGLLVDVGLRAAPTGDIDFSPLVYISTGVHFAW